MATEARTYALATFLTALMVYAFWRALHQAGRLWWVAYALAASMAVAVFVYSVLVVPALFAAAMSGTNATQRRRFAAASVASGASVAPLMLLAVTQRGQIGFLDTVAVRDILEAPAAAFFGGSHPVNALAWLGFTAASAFVWLRSIRHNDGDRRLALLTLAWLLLPASTLLAVSLVVPTWIPRYASISVPAFALCIGGGLAALGGMSAWRRAGATVLVLSVLAAASWWSYRQPDSKGDLLAAAQIVESHRRPGDMVWFSERPSGSDRTPRILRYAYPRAFGDAPDLTLERSYEESGELWETEVSLEAVDDLIESVDRMVGVSFSPEGLSTRAFEEDLSYLDEAGLIETERQSAGRWTVVVLERH